MNQAAILHIAKSPMAFPISEDTIRILLQTARNDVDQVELIVGDPFEWVMEDGVYHWAGRKEPYQLMKPIWPTDRFDHFVADVTNPTKRTKYAFLITSGNQRWFYGCRDLIEIKDQEDNEFLFDLFGYFNFPYINEEDMPDAPAWATNTIWYQIFPERFHRSENRMGDFLPWDTPIQGNNNHIFYGGDLEGVREKIPYLRDLGVTGIYFTPIFLSPSAHKYDTEDYFEIDPAFGTKADLKRLVEECHASGIKVMLDGVFNHCGFRHPFFQDVVQHQKASKYWGGFYIEDEDFINFPLDEHNLPKRLDIKPKFRTFAYTPHMPKLNTSHPLIREHLLEVGAYWVREFDIDGWRLDVSNEVSHDFWRAFKQRVRSVKKEVYLVGENWDDSTAWLRSDQFDAVMNYELAFPIWLFFGRSEGVEDRGRRIDAERFVELIHKLLVQYPEPIAKSMFNLVGTHDTIRILSRCGEDINLAKMTYLFIFSFIGSPNIFYGDEIGLSGATVNEARRPMPWGKPYDSSLLVFFKTLISLRNQRPEFQQLQMQWIYAKDQTIVYQKGKLIFCMNLSNEKVLVPGTKNLSSGTYRDLLSLSKVFVEDTLVLKPKQMYVLEKE